MINPSTGLHERQNNMNVTFFSYSPYLILLLQMSIVMGRGFSNGHKSNCTEFNWKESQQTDLFNSTEVIFSVKINMPRLTLRLSEGVFACIYRYQT